MSNIVSIEHPEILHIRDNNNQMRYGANQEWYRENWQRRAGCGPTTCSHLMWYLANTRLGAKDLVDYDGRKQDGFLQIMEDVWNYVTPTAKGVNSTRIFTDGADGYARDKGVEVLCKTLEVPAMLGKRPSAEQLADFLKNAFEHDRPVAFLNLSNGSLQNLDNWHWVTLTAFDEQWMTATMYDQEIKTEIEIGRWLQTTVLGGGFVALEIVGH